MDTDLDPEDWDADGDPPADKWPRTRIDLLFKPVYALGLRQLRYSSLRVRVATEQVAQQILSRLPPQHSDHQVLELVGPDGVGDHVVCLATGYCEDDGEDWEPSPFAADLSDGRMPAWRQRVLGGGPDGELTARYASVPDLVAAVHADPPHQPAGDKGRWLYVVMMGLHHNSDENRPHAVAAYLTRHEAEQHVARELDSDRHPNAAIPADYWVTAVPIDL